MNKRFLRRALAALLLLTSYILLLTSQACSPEPPLHLYDAQAAETDLPLIDLDLDVYWDYDTEFDIDYYWRSEWYYGWDETDKQIFGELGYTEPKVYELRRYYTNSTPYAPHTSVISDMVEGNRYSGTYNWGFWDLLVWNQITTLDGVQSLHFDEQTSLDSVTAYTNPSMHVSRYQAPRYTNSFYAPEPLFAAYEQAIDVNRDLRGFVYDAEHKVWRRTLRTLLKPITYIYLTQVILHNNNGRINAINGDASLSGLARSTTLNTGRGGEDAITVYYNMRMKRNMPLVPFGSRQRGTTTDNSTTGSNGVVEPEVVDIIGGRLMTFGICNLRANEITRTEEVADPYRHYMDLTMQFNNGIDSTFVFDVTHQVRRHFRGGVITVELNVDTIPIPSRKGGSGFDAVVKDFEDGGTHEFEM